MKIKYLLSLLVVALLVGCAKPSEPAATVPATSEPAAPAASEPSAPAAASEAAGAATAEVAGPSAEVMVNGKVFEPDSVSIQVGGTVTWKVADDKMHIVSSEGSYIKSSTLQKGKTETFEHTFDQAGTVKFVDTIWGSKMTVTVE